MASVGLNTIAALDTWTVSFLEASCSCCKRERLHSVGERKRKYQYQYQWKEASAGTIQLHCFLGVWVGGSVADWYPVAIYAFLG